MRFNLRRPCPKCPFRTDIPGYLTAARAQEIIEALFADDWAWFGCHETTEYVEDEETGLGDRQCVDSTQQCAGSLILLLKLGRPNVATRMAGAMGLIDLDTPTWPRRSPIAQRRLLSITPRSGGKSAVTDQLHELLRWPPPDPADPVGTLFLAIAARRYLPTAEEETQSTAAEVGDTGPFTRQMPRSSSKSARSSAAISNWANSVRSFGAAPAARRGRSSGTCCSSAIPLRRWGSLTTHSCRSAGAGKRADGL